LKYLFIILAVIGFTCPVAANNADTTTLINLYERTSDFSEDKVDSILINATVIEQTDMQMPFKQRAVMVQRLRGLYYDLTGDYNEALRYYLGGLALARETKLMDFEMSALTDLAILYSQIKSPEKALNVYRECLVLTKKHGTVADLISCYGNIGAIYNNLNMPDTALHYLSIGRSLCEQHGNFESIETIYNNTGNVYYKKKAFTKALGYFFLNRAINLRSNDHANLWLDDLNIGDSYLQMNSYDSARKYISESLDLSQLLRSKSKEADSYAMLARLEEKMGNYKRALEYQHLWYERDTSLVNQASSRNIAELQERFHAAERERENQELVADIRHQKTRNSFLTYLTLGALIMGVLTGIFLMAYRSSNQMLKDTNRVIQRQKEKLVELNEEKNALISVVSHDLGAPFSSIQMWAQLLERDEDVDRKTGLQNIRASAREGENLIRHILEVERMTLGEKQLDLEEVEITSFLQIVVNAFAPVAAAKQIAILYKPAIGRTSLLTDEAMLRQIIENLLSNAVKFSPPGQEIVLQVRKENEKIAISVQDHGPGISTEEQQVLFQRYAKGSASPTAGENSTGLGLFIVKRLVQELNGEISIQSAVGAGACFTVTFPLG